MGPPPLPDCMMDPVECSPPLACKAILEGRFPGPDEMFATP